MSIEANGKNKLRNYGVAISSFVQTKPEFISNIKGEKGINWTNMAGVKQAIVWLKQTAAFSKFIIEKIKYLFARFILGSNYRPWKRSGAH